MRAGPTILAASLIAFSLAGCLDGTAAPLEVHADDHSHAMGDHDHHEMDLSLLDGFLVTFKGCKEAGGVSLYNSQEGASGPTKDFKRTSIQDDTGNPKVASYFRPITSEATTGIWHTSLVCQGHTLNGQDMGGFEGGWVGVRIQPPEWDTSGIVRQYFVADLSFNAGLIVDLMKAATGLHISRNLDSKIDWVPLDKVPVAASKVLGLSGAPPMAPVLHTILDDEDHGVFETHGAMKDWTPKVSLEKIRFWMLINPHGHGHQDGEGANPKCECIPIAFDLESTKGSYMVIDQTGWLSHTRTDAHGAVPAAAGNVGGMAYMGFDRTFRVGEIPDKILEQTWLH